MYAVSQGIIGVAHSRVHEASARHCDFVCIIQTKQYKLYCLHAALKKDIGQVAGLRAHALQWLISLAYALIRNLKHFTLWQPYCSLEAGKMYKLYSTTVQWVT